MDRFGRSFIWREGAAEVAVNTNFDLPDSPLFKNSPLAILYASGHEVRYRLDDPESKRVPFFDDMRIEDVTDYIALPLLFTDGSIHAMSWCMRTVTHEGQARCHVPSCRMWRNVNQLIQQVLVIFDIMASKLIELPARCTRSVKNFKSRIGWYQSSAVASRVELAHARKNSRYQFRQKQ